MSFSSNLCRRNFSKFQSTNNLRSMLNQNGKMNQLSQPRQYHIQQKQDNFKNYGFVKGQQFESTLARSFSQAWYEQTSIGQVHDNYISNFETQQLTDQDKELYHIIRQMPKIELHTHIGGCMRQSTFLQLAKEKGVDVDHISFDNIEIPKTAWEIFAVLNQIVTDSEVLARSTKEVIEDYHAQGCVYLELRSTPKVIGSITSFEQYIRTVLEAILEAEEQFKGIKCAFLFSFKREWPIEEFSEAVDLYLDLIDRWNSDDATHQERQMVKRLVGIDLSGNPAIGHFSKEYQQELQRAQKKGVKIALHCAEVVEQLDSQEMIDFAPDRLGHCSYLTAKEVNQVVEMGITAEICPSSNMLATRLNSADQLPHLREFNKYSDSKIAIGCDDTLLFKTDLTKEMFLFAKATDLRTKEEIEAHVQKTALSTFMDDLKFKI